MEKLIKKVEHCILKDNLKSRCRKLEYTHRRMYLYNVLRKADFTYIEIAEMFNMNHATIMNAVKRLKCLEQKNDKLYSLHTAHYDYIFKKSQCVFDVRRDILEAKTLKDLRIIKGRTINKQYKNLIYGRK